MKTLKKIIIAVACISLLVACSKSDGFYTDNSPTDHKAGINNSPQGLDQDRYVTMKSMDLKVHYRIIGKGPVDMIFIPGWTNPLTVFTKQFDYFRDKARCIYIDLPGHGQSDAPEGIEYTQSLMADAIYDVVKKEGIQKFIGVGFSWGNTPLTQFELKHPGMITQLIFLDISINTWPPITQSIREATYAAQLAMTPQDKLAALNGLMPPATAPADLLEFGQYFLDFPNWLLANTNYHCLAEEVCQPYQWTVPTLVIYRVMKAGSAKEIRTRLYYPNCEIVVVGGDQHVIQWAYHETVNQLMDDFIADRPGEKY